MSQTKCILIIEDELELQRSLSASLEKEKFETLSYSSAEKALHSGALQLADAAIVDINLPGMNGFEVVKEIRKTNQLIPVMFLTAFSDVEHRLKGFETGGDDYLIKPFFMEELIARLRSLIKRYELMPGFKAFYQIDDLLIDIRQKTVSRGGIPIKLSLTEFNLLVLLAEAGGIPVSKEEILKILWKEKYKVGENTIEVYINLLRNKIDKPFPQKILHTKPGFGYFVSELQK